MRKLLLSLVTLVVTCAPIEAQTKFAESGLWDNWYVGANVGFNSKLTHNNFMSRLNPHLSLRAGRDIIPLVGVMAEITTFFNDRGFPAEKIGGNFHYSHTAIKAIDFDILGSLNLHNLFEGSLDYRRFFEARFLAGIGLNHVCGIESDSKNDFIAKFGFDFAFNLDKYLTMKGWEAYVEPALNFNLNRYSEHVEFNPNYAAWQLAIGVNYYFGKRSKKKDVTIPAPTPEPVVSVTTRIIPKTEQPKVSKTEPAKVEPVKVEPAKAEPAKVEPAKESVKVEHNIAEPEKEPVKIETTKVEAQKAEPIKPKKATAKATRAKKTSTKATRSKKASTKVVPTKEATAIVTPVKEATAKVTPAKEQPTTSTKQQLVTPPANHANLPSVHFNSGENILLEDQNEALSQVAFYLKNHPRAQLIIKGNTSHCNTVKNALVRRFGINATRLSTAAGTVADTVTFGEK